MASVRFHLAFCLLALSAGVPAHSQGRNLILIDPAHGGQDQGAAFNGVQEKDLTLGFAATLRALLTPRNFTVSATRDADLAVPSDQRAATGNHLRPAACLLLHATASGNGIHLITSSLTPLDAPASPLPWDTAQASFLPQSRKLANALGLALLRAKLPVTLTSAAVRPMDSLTCPAVAVEVAPLSAGSRSIPPSDSSYQSRLAEAIAAALTDWRNAQPAGQQPAGSGQ